MIIENTVFNEGLFQDADLFVFSLNYEERSYTLFEKLSSKLTRENSLCFIIENNQVKTRLKYDIQVKPILSQVYNVEYGHSDVVLTAFRNFLESKTRGEQKLRIHIDYSSMPRSWYCNLFLLLKELSGSNITAYFWYSEGDYPKEYESYPSAGTESYMLFSGKATTASDLPIAHIVALGYDSIRTSAIISALDPKYLIACYAYNQERKKVAENIEKSNAPILAKSAMSIILQINDFESILSRLCDITYELLLHGEVVLLPDGPKPLVLAMSLVPAFVDLPGVTSIHIKRNMCCFEECDVTPTGSIFGFSLDI